MVLVAPKIVPLPPACSNPGPKARLTERDSGTNLAASLLHINFNITQSNRWGFKHMYGDEHAMSMKLIAAAPTNTVVLLIVRELDAWLMAMYENCHECRNMVGGSGSPWHRQTFGEFLLSPWQSVNFNIKPPIALPEEKYTNIFALRRSKLLAMQKLLNASKVTPLATALWRFEDFAINSTRKSLCELHTEFNFPFHAHLNGVPLARLSEARKFVANKGSPHLPVRSYFDQDRTAVAVRCHLVDWDLEAFFGYPRPASCSRPSPPPPPQKSAARRTSHKSAAHRAPQSEHFSHALAQVFMNMSFSLPKYVTKLNVQGEKGRARDRTHRSFHR